MYAGGITGTAAFPFKGRRAGSRILRRETYRRALVQGDRHIAFLDGGRLFDGEMPDSCAVDGTHPNDLGFMRMAQQAAPALRELLRGT